LKGNSLKEHSRSNQQVWPLATSEREIELSAKEQGRVARFLIEDQQEMAGFFVVKPESAGVLPGRKAISFP
jgi:hypothetical protein